MAVKPWTFFLGANSKRGFVSIFEDLCAEPGLSDVYIIKSGPGTGKSTTMRTIADALQGEDERRENILCSSDPGTLDGVVLRDRGFAILDGTAPHARGAEAQIRAAPQASVYLLATRRPHLRHAPG